jgi:hypothetical protein
VRDWLSRRDGEYASACAGVIDAASPAEAGHR